MNAPARVHSGRRLRIALLAAAALAILLWLGAGMRRFGSEIPEAVPAARLDRGLEQSEEEGRTSRARDSLRPAESASLQTSRESASGETPSSSARSGRPRAVDALDGSPVAGARARAFSEPQGAPEETADDEGWLDLTSFLEGEAQALDVSGERHFPARFDLEELRARFDAGAAVTLPLPPAASLRARVVSELGEPVAGAHVEILLRDEGAQRGTLWAHLPRYSHPGNREHVQRVLEHARAQGAPVTRIEDLGITEALTDERGEFAFPPLPAGVALIVRCSGSVQPNQIDVVLPAGPGETRVDLVGRQGARVQGRLLRGRTPLGQVQVQIDSVSSRRSWQAYTSPDDGAFAVEGVASGRAVLHAEVTGFELRELEVAPPLVDLGELALPELVRCTGRLVSEHAFRGPGAFSVNFVSGRSRWIAASVDARGGFSARVPGGRHELLIGVAGMPGITGHFANFALAAPFADVEIAVDPFLGSISFLLVGSDGPATGEVKATLCLIEDDSSPELRPTGAGRRVSASLAIDGEGRGAWHHVVPGHYDLSLASAQAEACFLPDVEVRAGGTTDLGRIELGAGSLAGTVATGGSLSAADLELCASDPAGRRICTALGADGDYRLERLAPGPCRVELLDRRAFPLVAREIELLAGANRLDLALPPAARLEGRVISGSEPLAGAAVQLFPGGRPRAGLATLLRAESDAGGGFAFGGLPPGLYLVAADAPGGPKLGARIDVELAEGETREVELQLGGALAQVRFVLAGEVLLDVDEVWSFAGSLPGPVEVAFVAADSQGWADVPASSGPIHFLVRQSSREIEPTAWIFTSRTYLLAAEARGGLRPGERREIAVQGVTVELRHPADLPASLLPTLEIEGFADFDLLRHLPAYPLARLERRADGLRFAPVPPGARLVLTGPGESGRLREIRFRASADVVVDWP